jgi:hypothetical protein
MNNFNDDNQVLAKYTCENADGSFDVYDNNGTQTGDHVSRQVAVTFLQALRQGIPMNEESDFVENHYYELLIRVAKLEDALRLIAAPKRPDGTYNRCREACEQLAKEALDERD